MTSLECRKAVVGETATNAEELRRMRAAVWHKMGLAVIDPEKIANEFERQRVVNTANQLYGKRAVG